MTSKTITCLRQHSVQAKITVVTESIASQLKQTNESDVWEVRTISIIRRDIPDIQAVRLGRKE